MRVYKYELLIKLDENVTDTIHLEVKTDPRTRIVYYEGEPIGEITGWGSRHGYRVKGSPINSNHKSVGSAAHEAYYMFALRKAYLES